MHAHSGLATLVDSLSSSLDRIFKQEEARSSRILCIYCKVALDYAIWVHGPLEKVESLSKRQLLGRLTREQHTVRCAREENVCKQCEHLANTEI